MSETDTIMPDDSPGSSGGAKKGVRNAFVFLLALGAFFSLGFFVIGPRMQRNTASAPSTHIPAPDKEGWGLAPPPPRPKPAAAAPEVEISEIAPGSAASSDARANTHEADTLDKLSHTPETPAAPTSDAVETEPPPRTPHRFYVQVGVYEDKTNARILASRLADEGYGSSIRQVSRNGAPAYQVVIGSAREKSEAQKLVDELRAAGKDVLLAPAD